MLLVSILYVPLYRNYLFMDQLYYIIGTIDISMVPKMFVAISLVEKLYHLPQLYRYLLGKSIFLALTKEMIGLYLRLQEVFM